MLIPAEKLMIMSRLVSFLRNRVEGIIGIWRGKKLDTGRLGPRRYSYEKKRMQRMPPTMKGAMTAADAHGYCVPPHCMASMMQPTPSMKRIRPGQSMMVRPEM